MDKACTRSLLLLCSLFTLLSALPALSDDVNPIDKFQEIEPGLYRGGSPGPEGVAYLKKKYGIKTIIDLEGGKKAVKAEREAAARLGILFVHNPIGLFTIPGTRKVDKLLDLMKNPAARPLFVHCRAGKDRTGLFAGLYRVEMQGWQPGHAAQEMLDFGFKTYWFPLTNIFERRTGFDLD